MLGIELLLLCLLRDYLARLALKSLLYDLVELFDLVPQLEVNELQPLNVVINNILLLAHLRILHKRARVAVNLVSSLLLLLYELHLLRRGQRLWHLQRLLLGSVSSN